MSDHRMRMERILEVSNRRAGEFHREIIWGSVGTDIRLFIPNCRAAEDDVVAQVESAIGTCCLCNDASRVRLVILLNESGHSRPAESLIHGTFRNRITSANFIAACELRGASGNSTDDAIVIWIDDLSRPEPFKNPYSSRIKAFLFRHYPVLLDELRQRRSTILNRRMAQRIRDLTKHQASITFHHQVDTAKRERTVLFCLYWLDFGGAETFAVQTMEAAKGAGFKVVVICDENGRHRLLSKVTRIADAVYMLGSFRLGLGKEEACIRVIERYRPAIIHIHHAWTMYRLLPFLRAFNLVSGVMDTTHIIEHRDSGFVGEAALYSEYLDAHHVISEDLEKFFTEELNVNPFRLKLGRLHDLSREHRPHPEKWVQRDPVRVVFVGRFSQQKRPYLFVEIVKKLVRRHGPGKFSFQALGEGTLRAVTEDLARYSDVSQFIEFLPGTAPVQDVLGTAHVLLVPSDNEGLTLVAFEAIRAECLVISCDVGAQREIVASNLLVSKYPSKCVKLMSNLVSRLVTCQLEVEPLLAEQKHKLQAILSMKPGSDVCLEQYEALSERLPAHVSPS